MKFTKLILILLTLFFLQACSNTTPETYHQKAVLSTNLVLMGYSPQFFDEILELKDKGRLTVFKDNRQQPATAAEYMEHRLPDLSKNISEIKSLKKTDETEAMLDASLDFFEHAQKIFNQEYPKIAEMIDAGQPRAATEAAIIQIFETHDPQMKAKYEKLEKIADSYAKKHDIEVRKL